MRVFEQAGSERGAGMVLAALSMVAIISVAALAIDIGLLTAERTRLHATADAAALAGAAVLPDPDDVTIEVQAYAALNHSNVSVRPDDIILGNWNDTTGIFSAGATPINAVAVTVRRTESRGNAVPTFFARIFGVNQVDVSAQATARGKGGGVTSRFIIDDEMIDSDIPVVENLAASLGIDSEDLISDLDGDWFIDLPPRTVLELPTGQVGDEGMFDMEHPEWPFTQSSHPSFEDFLNYNEDSSSWRYGLFPKEILDPLVGVSTVSDADEYDSYVNPEGCQVSPVYKSDVNELDPVNGVPAVNALGERRGLLAFKILAVGADTDGSGSVLPNLVIEVYDPFRINLPDVKLSSGVYLRLVQ